MVISMSHTGTTGHSHPEGDAGRMVIKGLTLSQYSLTASRREDEQLANGVTPSS